MIPTFADSLIIKEQLYPFTETRELIDIRIGILTIREKWERLSALRNVAELPKTAIPANLVPSLSFFDEFLTIPEQADLLASPNARFLNYPWDIFGLNDWAIREDFRLLVARRHSQPIPETVQTVKSTNIFVEEGASMQHCVLNASTGPIYIGKDAEVMEGAIIRGPFALGEGAVVKMGAKIYGATTVGPHCVVGGEIKNSVLFGYSNKAHDGYLGDSVIGEWCNLGAGTSNSNLRNTAANVKVWSKQQNGFVDAGLKCGLLMGDFSRSAINSSFNTGTVVGVGANYFTPGLSAKHIPSFSWGTEKYQFNKAIKDIGNWKKLKNQELSEKEIQTLQSIFEAAK